jgi:hypothetical protein
LNIEDYLKSNDLLEIHIKRGLKRYEYIYSGIGNILAIDFYNRLLSCGNLAISCSNLTVPPEQHKQNRSSL